MNAVEYIRCKDMERGLTYPIIEIECVARKYGAFLPATIQDPQDVNQ